MEILRISNLTEDHPKSIDINIGLGISHKIAFEFVKALEYFDKCMRNAKNRFGDEHIIIGEIQNYIGEVQIEQV